MGREVSNSNYCCVCSRSNGSPRGTYRKSIMVQLQSGEQSPLATIPATDSISDLSLSKMYWRLSISKPEGCYRVQYGGQTPLKLVSYSGT